MTDLTTTLALHLLGRASRPGEGTLRLSGAALGTPGEVVSGTGAPDVTLRVHDRRAFGAVLRRGSVGLATGYRDGWWDADDLSGLVRVLMRRTEGVRRAADMGVNGLPVAQNETIQRLATLCSHRASNGIKHAPVCARKTSRDALIRRITWRGHRKHAPMTHATQDRLQIHSRSASDDYQPVYSMKPLSAKCQSRVVM